MEPLVESLILHPSLLIASGVECISSRDARFLNAYRKYFGNKKVELTRSWMLTENDFTLGGVMNPNDAFLVPEIAYRKCLRKWYGFPYFSYHKIFELVYKDQLISIQQKIFNEIISDIHIWAQSQNMEDLRVRIQRPSHSGEIYAKVLALHLCGLGEKLRDAFSLMIDFFEKQQKTTR